MQPDWAAGHGQGHVKAERAGQKLGAELGQGLVQFPRRSVFKCSRRVGGGQTALRCPPTLPDPPESHVRSPPLARTTAVIFQLVLLRGGVWGGAVPTENLTSNGGECGKMLGGKWGGQEGFPGLGHLFSLHKWSPERMPPDTGV